jgi:regulator of replication initiation timing
MTIEEDINILLNDIKELRKSKSGSLEYRNKILELDKLRRKQTRLGNKKKKNKSTEWGDRNAKS